MTAITERGVRHAMAPIMCAIVVAAAPAAFGAREVNQPQPVTFRPISSLEPPAGAKTSMIGRKPAKPKDWPASFYTMHGDGACTSNLVGPRALLTAAHCVAEPQLGKHPSAAWSTIQ